MFFKIDLTKAYLQVELDDGLQRYLTINKSKGLKQIIRMPYGVKPATAIIQRFIENTLANTPYTDVKLDDISINGKTDMDHFKNIEKVSRVLKETGPTISKKKCIFFCQGN